MSVLLRKIGRSKKSEKYFKNSKKNLREETLILRLLKRKRKRLKKSLENFDLTWKNQRKNIMKLCTISKEKLTSSRGRKAS